MLNSFFRKGLVFSVIVLFIGVVIAPNLNSISNKIDLENPLYIKTNFNPFKQGWKYRKQITINQTKVAGNLVNFPVLVSTIDPDLAGKTQEDGDDILFMNDIGEAKQLAHEIEFYNNSKGELIAWINIPSLLSNSDSYFYIYYGNPNVNNQQNPTGVWDANYVTVHHMNDNPDNMSISDSTINNIDGYKKNQNEPLEQVGIIGYGQKYDGLNDHIYLDHDPRLDAGLNDRTYEIWVTVAEYISSGFGEGRFIISKQPTGGRQPRTSIGVNKFTGFVGFVIEDYINGDTTVIRGSTDVRGGTYYIVAIRDRSADELRLYVNGVQDNTPVIDGDQNGTNTGDLCIGDHPYALSNGRVFKDVIDEFRVSTVVRCDNWIKTTYNNQNDPSSFLIFGVEESSLKSTFVIGSFEDINTEGNTMIIDALNIRCIQTSPFAFVPYTSGEKLIISKEGYTGLLIFLPTTKFIIAICKMDAF